MPCTNSVCYARGAGNPLGELAVRALLIEMQADGSFFPMQHFGPCHFFTLKS